MATPDLQDPPPPPQGFASWLDYAVATCDLRRVELEYLFREGGGPSREAMRQALEAELRALRQAAGGRDAKSAGD